ncbi:hypothetical protein ACHAQA_006150 [Verticillium albo-atrum]
MVRVGSMGNQNADHFETSIWRQCQNQSLIQKSASRPFLQKQGHRGQCVAIPDDIYGAKDNWDCNGESFRSRPGFTEHSKDRYVSSLCRHDDRIRIGVINGFYPGPLCEDKSNEVRIDFASLRH